MSQLLSLLDELYLIKEEELVLTNVDNVLKIKNRLERGNQQLIDIIDLINKDPDYWLKYPVLVFDDTDIHDRRSIPKIFAHKLRYLDPLETYLPKEREMVAADIARFLLKPDVKEELLEDINIYLQKISQEMIQPLSV
jgi:predicted transcriptional regulator